jgi:hypothetical protein
MAINTNNCFVGFNKILPADGMVLFSPGYDAGTEVNNELCTHVPGPACGTIPTSDPGGGEGFIHVHRGIHGIGGLAAADYDWRNPMIQIKISKTA